MRTRIKHSHAYLRGMQDFYQNRRINPFASSVQKQREWALGYLSASKGKMSSSQLGRSEHINMIINVERFGAYKNQKESKEKNGIVDLEIENEKEAKRNLEIINIIETKLRSGKNKGEKVPNVIVNNPPKKRYFPHSWK